MMADQYSRVAALHHALDQGAETDETGRAQRHAHERSSRRSPKG